MIAIETVARSDFTDGVSARRLASQNWDRPVVVTTTVQFFESLFSNRPSRCRKLHNIAKSVVVLACGYDASIVMCTATQPLTQDRNHDDKAVMAIARFFAHSTESTNKSDWQPLVCHLLDVAKRAEVFAGKFGAGEWGRVLGLLHDAGKYSAEFQRRLAGDKRRADHATAGAKIAADRYGQLGRILAYAIAGHHAGLANGTGDGPPAPLERRLDQEYLKSIPNCDAWRGEVEALLPGALAFPALGTHPEKSVRTERVGLCMALFTRMLFSALVDADRLDAEEFKLRAKGEASAPRGDWEPEVLTRLKEKLDAHLAGLAADAAGASTTPLAADVNAARAEVLAAARTMAAETPGLFSLTVPTGGGKTLSSLAFALGHTVAHPQRFDRIIYVIPFTSIIEQTAAVFRKAFGADLAVNVIEHHSAFQEPAEDDAAGTDVQDVARRASLATENWDAPIVVTTAVQFFESLFSNRPGRCRKLHNVAKSVVILDEAQTLPLNLLRPSVAVLDELARNYKTTAVLCTATQPALLATRADGSEGFSGGFARSAVREIAPEPAKLYDRLRRVTVKPSITLTDDELARLLLGHDKVLCIVGTRAHARHLHGLLLAAGDGAAAGVFHLSALMCPAHRSGKLAGIKDALVKGPCRVVATTVVEAGVDIDFPAVYRVMAGLDSVAQAAGRCNREGRAPKDDSVVQLFEIEGRTTIPELRKFAQAARSVMSDGGHDQDLLSPETIEAYFRELYWSQEAGRDDKLDKHGIARGENYVVSRDDILIPFADIARNFRMIESGMEPVIVPYDQRARDLIAELSVAERVRDVARKLQPYMVNVPRSAFAELRRKDRIQPVNPHRFEDRFMALTDEAHKALYRKEDGFDFSDATYQAVENLVV